MNLCKSVLELGLSFQPIPSELKSLKSKEIREYRSVLLERKQRLLYVMLVITFHLISIFYLCCLYIFQNGLKSLVSIITLYIILIGDILQTEVPIDLEKDRFSLHKLGLFRLAGLIVLLVMIGFGYVAIFSHAGSESKIVNTIYFVGMYIVTCIYIVEVFTK
jgi:hypothetical protein